MANLKLVHENREMLSQGIFTPVNKSRKRISCPVETFELVSVGRQTPHPDKTGPGEDAFFTTKFCAGVADGVGGWIELNIDSGKYSRMFMECARREAEENEDRDPFSLIRKAFDETDAVGTSTVTIVSIDNGRLYASNVGDSGVLVLRIEPTGIKRILESEPQTHFWNCPKQLGTESHDMPSDADHYDCAVQEGDFVILATDGVLDNLFVHEIMELVENGYSSTDTYEQNAAKIAEAIMIKTHYTSQNRKCETPFSRGSIAHNFEFVGGKLDDITVVVSIVSAVKQQSHVFSSDIFSNLDFDVNAQSPLTQHSSSTEGYQSSDSCEF